MRNLDNLILCLPGAELISGLSPDGAFNASIALSLGPIRPTFRGQGRFTYVEANRSGEIVGVGEEQRGASRASGRMSFRLTPEEANATRIAVEIGYRLTGPLAHFARPALVAGIASEVGAAFASNLDCVLRGREIDRASTRGLGASAFLRPLWQDLLRFIRLWR